MSFLVLGPDCVYAEFDEEELAIEEREFLTAEGYECWVVPTVDPIFIPYAND